MNLLIIRVNKSGRMSAACSTAWRALDIQTIFYYRKLKASDHLEDRKKTDG
jgi:hypothetical protein